MTLSAQGMFLCLREQLPKGGQVDIDLPLGSGEILTLAGTVIFSHGTDEGDSLLHGLAIRFDPLAEETREVLNKQVAELLPYDCFAEHRDPSPG